MKNTPLFRSLAVLVMVIVLALFPAAAQTGSAEDALTGKPAPDFELKLVDANGKTLKLSQLKGKAVLVSFWATWCGPCKVEMPWLIDLQKKYGPQGLQIVGISMDDGPESDISAFTQKMGVNYPILLGTEKVADLYGGVDALPETFFIDRSGKIVSHEMGLVSLSIIEDKIKKSLGPAEAVQTTASVR